MFKQSIRFIFFFLIISFNQQAFAKEAWVIKDSSQSIEDQKDTIIYSYNVKEEGYFILKDVINFGNSGIKAIDLINDTIKKDLILIYEESDFIHVLKNAAETPTQINLIEGSLKIASAAYDSAENRLYTSSKDSNEVRTYLLDTAANTLTLENLFFLPEVSKISGMALSKDSGKLFITDSTQTIRCYENESGMWILKNQLDVNHEVKSIAVNDLENAIYAVSLLEEKAWLSKLDLNLSPINSINLQDSIPAGEIGEKITGITTDISRSFVYLTTERQDKDGRIWIFDKNLIYKHTEDLNDFDEYNIQTPKGIAIKGEHPIDFELKFNNRENFAYPFATKGENFSCFITIFNNKKQALENVIIELIVPDNTTLVSSFGGEFSQINANTIVLAVPIIESKESKIYTVTLTAPLETTEKKLEVATFLLSDQYPLIGIEKTLIYCPNTGCEREMLAVSSDEQGHVYPDTMFYQRDSIKSIEAFVDAQCYKFDKWGGSSVDKGQVKNFMIPQTEIFMSDSSTLHCGFVAKDVGENCIENEIFGFCTEAQTCDTTKNLTILATENGVTTPPTGVINYPHGSTETLTATPNICYSFVNWTDENGSEVSQEGEITLLMDQDRNIKANFVSKDKWTSCDTGTCHDGTCIPPKTLTMTAGEGGSITSHAEEITTHDHDTTVTITALAKDCYTFAAWAGTNTDKVTDALSTTTTIKMDGNYVLEATFTYNGDNSDCVGGGKCFNKICEGDKTLTISAGHGGILTSHTVATTEYDHKSIVTITAEPHDCFAFAGWTGDNSFVTDASLASTTVEMIDHCNLVATFAYKGDNADCADGGKCFDEICEPDKTLTTSSLKGGSVIDPEEATSSYNHNTDVTLTASEDECFTFDKWTGTCKTATNDKSTTVKMTEDCLATSNFLYNGDNTDCADGGKCFNEVCEGDKTLTISSGEGGNIVEPGSGATYDHNSTPTITANEDDCFTFNKWTGTGAGKVTNANDKSTTILMDGDYGLEATYAYNGDNSDCPDGGKCFEKTCIPPKTLTITFGEGGTITSPSTEVSTHAHNSTPQITAVAKDCYSFAEWIGPDANKVTDATKANTTIKMDGNYALEATFTYNGDNSDCVGGGKCFNKICEGDKTLTISAGHGGIITSPSVAAAEYDHKSTITITAQPHDCFAFAGWTGTAVDSGFIADASLASTTVEMIDHCDLVATFTYNGDTTNCPNEGKCFEEVCEPKKQLYIIDPGKRGDVLKPEAQITVHDHNNDVPIEAIESHCFTFTEWNGTGKAKVANSVLKATTIKMDANYNIGPKFAYNGDYTNCPNDSKCFAEVCEPKKSLTINENVGGKVIGTYQDLYDHNSTVKIVTAANECFTFSHWEGAGIANKLNPTTTVTMDQNRTIEPIFTYHGEEADCANGGQCYNYICEADKKLTMIPSKGGKVVQPATSTYDHYATPKIVAEDNECFTFTNWAGTCSDEIADVNAKSTTVRMVKNCTAQPIFVYDGDNADCTGGGKCFDEICKPDKTLTITAGEGGLAAAETTGPYDHNTVVTVTASALDCYTFTGWTGTGANKLADASALSTTIVMNNNYTLKATFTYDGDDSDCPNSGKCFSKICEPDKTLTTSSSKGGSVINPATSSYDHNTDVAIEAEAVDCFYFSEWTGTGTAKVANTTANPSTIKMDGNYDIHSNFAYYGDGAHCAIGNRCYNEICHPDKTLTISANHGGKVVEPKYVKVFDHNKIVTITALEDDCYEFTGWIGSGVDAGKVTNPNSLSTKIIMGGDYTVVATFVEKADNGDCSDGGKCFNTICQLPKTLIASAPANSGFISMPTSEISTHDYNSEVKLVAGEKDCFTFDQWDGRCLNQIADIGSKSTTIKMIDDCVVNAKFDYNGDGTDCSGGGKCFLTICNGQKTLTISAGEGGDLVNISAGEHIYDHNSKITISAKPKDCFAFAGWVGGNIANSTALTTTITMSDHYNVQATFTYNGDSTDCPNSGKCFATVCEPDKTLDPSTSKGGSMTPDQSAPYDHNTVEPIIAEEDDCFTFSEWTGTGAAKVANVFEKDSTILMDGNYAIKSNFAYNGDNTDCPNSGKCFDEICEPDKTLTITTNEGGLAAAKTAGPYDHNSLVTITATELDCYVFTGWIGSGVDDNKVANPNEKSTTILMDKDYSVEATFAYTGDNTDCPDSGKCFARICELDKKLTVTAGNGGTIALPITQVSTHDHNTQPTIAAEQNECFTFSNWEGTCTINDTKAKSTKVKMTEDCSANALFAYNGDNTDCGNGNKCFNEVCESDKTLTLTATEGGSAKTDLVGPYDHNTVVTVTASSLDCFTFTGWIGTGASKLTDASAPSTTITMDASYTLEATFAYNGNSTDCPNSGKCFAKVCEPDKILEMVNSEGGTITHPIEAVSSYDHGTIVPIKAAVNDCFTFTDWSGTGADQVANASAKETTSQMNGNYVLHSNFAYNGDNTNCPNSGKCFAEVCEPKKALTITAGEGGLATAITLGPYNHNTEVTITATAQDCFTFAGWIGTGVDSGKVVNPNIASTKILMDGDYTVEATFTYNSDNSDCPNSGKCFAKVCEPDKLLTVTSAMGGYISTPTETKTSHEHNTQPKIAAEENECFTFSKWIGTGAAKIADVTSKYTNITMNADQFAQATFAYNGDNTDCTTGGKCFNQICEQDKRLILSSSAGGSIVTPVNGIYYDHNAVVQIEARAKECYNFSSWTGTGYSSIKNRFAASTEITMQGNYAINANFRTKAKGTPCHLGAIPGECDYGTCKTKKRLKVTLDPKTASLGSTLPVPEKIRSYDHGTKATLKAVPKAGHEVQLWIVNGKDHSDDPEIILDMTEHKNVQVTFQKASWGATRRAMAAEIKAIGPVDSNYLDKHFTYFSDFIFYKTTIPLEITQFDKDFDDICEGMITIDDMELRAEIYYMFRNKFSDLSDELFAKLLFDSVVRKYKREGRTATRKYTGGIREKTLHYKLNGKHIDPDVGKHFFWLIEDFQFAYLDHF